MGEAACPAKCRFLDEVGRESERELDKLFKLPMWSAFREELFDM
jgi:hypothetical protein